METLFKAIINLSGASGKEVKHLFQTTGDIGIVAEKVLTGVSTDSSALLVTEVYDTFIELGKLSGNNSVELKENLIKKLLAQAGPEGAKFIIRWLVGNLKTGAGEKTIIAALSRAIVR